MKSFVDPSVEHIFAAYPDAARPRMLALRDLVFETAAGLPQVGAIEETLKWGEPAYLTPVTHSGSTIRMDWKPRSPDVCGLYFNCKTTLVGSFRELFGDAFQFEGERAVLVPASGPFNADAVRTCFAAALTYHLRN